MFKGDTCTINISFMLIETSINNFHGSANTTNDANTTKNYSPSITVIESIFIIKTNSH